MATLDQSRIWRERNKEKIRAYEAEYRKRPGYKLKKAERDRKWRQANRLRKRENDRRWRKANPDKVAAQQRRYRAKHPEKRRKQGVDARLLSNWDSKICGICKSKIESKYEIDHIIPISRGGTNSLENLQLAHPICNRTKNSRLQKDIDLDIIIVKELNAF